jgi:hypothetical protein
MRKRQKKKNEKNAAKLTAGVSEEKQKKKAKS